MPRKRYPTIKQGADGLWHAWVTVGTKPNGRPDQRHVKRAEYEDVEERVDELLDQKRAGAVVRPGRAITVEQWMETYLDTVAPRRCDPSTVADYRSKCVHWVFPVVGSTRLDRLTPEQLDQVYLRMSRAGKADSSILKTHRILTRALEIAYRRQLAPRNVAKLLDSPTFRKVETKPLTEEDALAVLAAADAGGHRNLARWSVGLAIGLRQGEALGLRWEYVDLDQAEVRVWWQLRRRSFEHGCGGTCGRRRGGNCPQRQLPLRSGEVMIPDLSKLPGEDRRTAMILKEPKGTSRRTIPIPPELVEQLRAHKAGQELERVLAGSIWQDHDLVFAEPDGTPIDPSDDHREWKAIVGAAGVSVVRLHDARHTAATLLLAQGFDIAVVQEILGHSDVRVTRGYVHVASELARKATDRMGATLLGRPRTP